MLQIAVCALALRTELAIPIFFTSSTRARSLLTVVRSRLAADGGALVETLRTYSRTLWAGKGAAIAAAGATLPAVRRTPLENRGFWQLRGGSLRYYFRRHV